MKIEFDPAKDAINIRKHGISLSEAKRFDWDSAFIYADNRYPYDEWRMIGLGLIEADVFYVAFVERGDVTRVFSLRPAEKKEITRYVHYLAGR